jgi:hypothetical protein
MYEQGLIFRKAHGLESTPGNIFSNITKETIELLDEVEAENALGMVDELCDHVIYPINIIEALGHDAKSNIESLGLEDSPILDCNDITPKMAVSCIMMALANWNIEKDIKALALIARIALKALHSLGYDSELCVIEKFKCINSREGSYNTLADKWEKDINQNPDTIYQPKYEQCKKDKSWLIME